MTVFYLIFIGLTIYFSIRYDGIEEYDSHKVHRMWLMCGYLVCLSGFSYGLGADKFTYMEEFEYYSKDLSETGDFILKGLMIRGQGTDDQRTDAFLDYSEHGVQNGV